VSAKQYAAVNVQGTANLLEEALAEGVKQVIFASTPGVQGKGYASAKEDFPYNPPYDYERTKCQAEELCRRIGKENGLPVTIIRPDFVYGPGDTRRLAFYRAIKRKRFLVVGNGQAILHPTYIDDAVKGFLLVVENPVAMGQTFNIGGPNQVSVMTYVETICRCLDVSMPRLRIPKGVAMGAAIICEAYFRKSGREPFLSKSKIEFLTQDHGSNITKARSLLGYVPKVTLSEGIKMTVDWYRRNNLLH